MIAMIAKDSRNGAPQERSVEAFGKRLKSLRDSRGWSAADLAKRANIQSGPDYVYQIEAGRRKSPGLDVVVKLATAFRVSLDELVGFDASTLPAETAGSGAGPDPRVDAMLAEQRRQGEAIVALAQSVKALAQAAPAPRRRSAPPPPARQKTRRRKAS